MKTKSLGLLLAANLLGGCVVGQSLTYDYTPTAPAERQTGTVSVTVKDERSYVISGDKTPDYLGHYRAGFGNPWDVTTKGKKPFADLMAADLREEIAALGFTQASGGKSLAVSIREWNMDTYVNARLWYELLVRVLAADGTTVLVEQDVADERSIAGSFWVGAKGAVENAAPAMYQEAIQKIVRGNPTVLNALGSP